MSSITYDKSNIDVFLEALGKYKTEKEEYKKKIENFKSVMDFMKNTYKDGAAAGFSNSDTNFTLNSDHILMKNANVPDGSTGLTVPDTSINTVISDSTGSGSAFYSDKKYDTDSQFANAKSGSSGLSLTNGDGIKANKLHQLGFSDVTYDDSEKRTSNEFGVIPNDLYPDVSNGSDCGMSDLYRCSSLAKVTDNGSKAYGLEQVYNDGTSICNCYIFGEDNLDGVETRLRSVNVDITGDESINYLAILMDTRLYGLKKSTYSGNYTGLYDTTGDDTTGTNLVIVMENSPPTGVNPFVGMGINRVEIQEKNDGTNNIGFNCNAAGACPTSS